MGYEDIKSGITKVLQDTKEKTIKVTEEVISCENDHPIAVSYTHLRAHET